MRNLSPPTPIFSVSSLLNFHFNCLSSLLSIFLLKSFTLLSSSCLLLSTSYPSLLLSPSHNPLFLSVFFFLSFYLFLYPLEQFFLIPLLLFYIPFLTTTNISKHKTSINIFLIFQTLNKNKKR